MRDKNRIKPFLLEIEKLWEKNPDYRFGQLIYLITEYLGSGDIFFPEDDKWLKAITVAGTPDYSQYKISGDDLDKIPWVTDEEEWVKELLSKIKRDS